MILKPCVTPLTGQIYVQGDKSISHRAVILGALAKGTTKVSHFLDAEDCMRTIDACKALGVIIEKKSKSSILVHGKGISAFKEPDTPLYYGNSGTTARLMLGVLAGLPFFTSAYGDASLTKRPMNRVLSPMMQMGAQFDGRNGGDNLPLAIRGGNLHGIRYKLPVKSAQVKSAVLLAGLLAEGTTEIIEQTPTRDHTENMLRSFGADITKHGKHIKITNQHSLKAVDIHIPGDVSSAAFFLVAAAIVPDSMLTLKSVGLNDTRTGIIDVMKDMGASIFVQNKQSNNGESWGDITLTYRSLQGTIIEGDIIPRLIDEIPVIALLATQAEGSTVIRHAKELRLKETDRIAAVVEGLSNLGAQIEATEDGMIIHGKTPLTGGEVACYDDHRIAMMVAIASLIAKNDVILDDASSIAISYPNFFKDLQYITNTSKESDQ